MGNVWRHVRHGAMWTVVVALLTITTFVLLVHPRIFKTNTYMDVNSGDIRVETLFCGLRVWERTRVTAFSREVRRLGITVPDDRIWRLARTEQALLMGTHSHTRLDPVRVNFELLIDIVAHGKVSDEERAAIFRSILSSLKKDPGEIGGQIEALEHRVYGEG